MAAQAPVVPVIEDEFVSMLGASLSIFGEGKLPAMHRTVLSAAITEFGCGVAEMLTYLQPRIALNEDDVVLTLSLPPERTIEEARTNLAKEKNSYHLFAIEENSDETLLRFRISTVGRLDLNKEPVVDINSKQSLPKKKIKVKNTPADFLQGLLKAWLKFPLPRVSKSLQTGIYQKVAESLNSFFKLYYEGDSAGQQGTFPNTAERRPEVRTEMRQVALDTLSRRTVPLEYRTARELYPADYEPDDPKGNRLICISDDWLKFIVSPFPERFPAFFVNQSGKSPVRIYEKEGRLFAFLPILTADKGPLVPQSGSKLDWWFKRRADFKALPLFESSWPKSGTGIMVPLGYDSNPHKTKQHQGWIESSLRCAEGIGTILFKEHRSSHPGRTGVSGNKLRKSNEDDREWKIQFALRYSAKIPLTTRTMGIHFGNEPIVYWFINGTDIQGSFDWSIQIKSALARQAELEKDQRRQRSTAHRGFSKENRAWVREVARKIVLTAKEYGCSLAREVIKYVPQKRSEDAALNRRFSMWCFSDLGSEIDHQANKANVFVVDVSDYEVKFRCPVCGAIRTAGQTPKNATTYIRKSDNDLALAVFECRSCGSSGPCRPEVRALNCAQIGNFKILQKIKKLEEKASQSSEM